MRASRGLLGGLGLIKFDLDYVPTCFEDFVKNLAQPCIILTRSRKHNFFGGGISAVTKSPWQHALIYLGRSMGERARKLYPELMGKRIFCFRNIEKELPPIPKKESLHEIIESSVSIRFGTIEEYKGEENQLAAWMKPLTPQEIDSVLFRALLMHGMPYDVQEIASFLKLLPNPEDGKIVFENGLEFPVGMKVCSSFTSYAFDLPLAMPSPGDLEKHFLKTSGWSRLKYNN